VNALLFLYTRRFINSFRRAFNNPGRTVGTLAIVALILGVYGGPLLMPSQQPPAGKLLRVLPPLEIAASILTLMVFGFLALSFEVALNYTRAFTESDVSNLFPTPLPRKLVFQFSLFTKGLLGSIGGALIIGYFLVRSTRALLLMIPGGVPLGSGILGAVAFMLLFIIANAAILQLGVVCGLSVLSRKVPKGVLWTIIAAVFLLFVGIPFWHFSEYSMPGGSFFGTLLEQLHRPPGSWFFLPFRAVADCALVALQGWSIAIPIGVGAWASLFVLCQMSLHRFSPWMYEYAIHLAQGNTKRREMLKQHSYYIGAGSKRREKRSSVVSTWRWMERWTPAGASALFWRNLILIRRFGGLLVVKVYVGVTVLMGLGIEALRIFKPNAPLSELLAFGGVIQFFLIFAFVPSNIAWLSQTLKRFEIQKPLPITAIRTVFAELLTPILVVAISNLFGLAVLTILFPRQWSVLALGYLTAGSGYMLMSCLLFIVLLFNPDQDDTLQRMLFGIFQMLVFVIAFIPSAVVITAGLLLHVSPMIMGIVALLTNCACMYPLIVLAAKKYETFNPLE